MSSHNLTISNLLTTACCAGFAMLALNADAVAHPSSALMYRVEAKDVVNQFQPARHFSIDGVSFSARFPINWADVSEPSKLGAVAFVGGRSEPVQVAIAVLRLPPSPKARDSKEISEAVREYMLDHVANTQEKVLSSSHTEFRIDPWAPVFLNGHKFLKANYSGMRKSPHNVENAVTYVGYLDQPEAMVIMTGIAYKENRPELVQLMDSIFKTVSFEH